MGKPITIPLELGSRPTIVLNGDELGLEICGLKAGEAPHLEAWGPRSREQAAELLRNDGETTVISTQHFGWMGLEKLVLHVPKHVRATVRADMGYTRVENLEGCDLTLSAMAGKLELRNVRGRMTLNYESGAIDGESLAGTFNVRAAAGAVKLDIFALDEGAHTIRSAMGSVKVWLAPGIDVKIDTHTSLGSARCRYPSNPSAPRTLTLEADLGSVKVLEGGDKKATARGSDWLDWRRLWNRAIEVMKEEIAEELKPVRRVATATSSAPAPGGLRQVLEMVRAGKLSAAEAERLLALMSEG